MTRMRAEAQATDAAEDRRYGPERRAAVWQTATDAARTYAGPDGNVTTSNETICVSARR